MHKFHTSKYALIWTHVHNSYNTIQAGAVCADITGRDRKTETQKNYNNTKIPKQETTVICAQRLRECILKYINVFPLGHSESKFLNVFS